jgi:hypothetical protein
MSIESRNVEIEPVSCAYAVLTEHVSEFLRLKLEESGVNGFIDCRAGVKYDPKAKDDEDKHQMHILAFFATNSKDINYVGGRKSDASSIFLDRMDRGGAITPSEALRKCVAPFVSNDKIYINKDDSSTYSIDLDVYRLFGMMFDADFIKEEIVVLKYDKVSDINYKFTIVKQNVSTGRDGGHKDILSMKANRRIENSGGNNNRR